MRNLTLSIIVFLIAALNINVASAQGKDGFIVKRADQYYNSFDFATAAAVYQNASEKNPENLYVKGQVGNCYRFLNDIGSAEEWYGAVAASDSTDPIYKFYFAQSLMSNGKYPEALTALNSYYSAMGKPEKVKNAYPQDIFSNDDRYSVEIEDFNSEHADFSPFKINDKLFFVSNRNNNTFFSRDDVWSERPFTQLYVMNLESEETDSLDTDVEESKPKIYRRDNLSKRFHEGPIGFDEANSDIYITRSNYGNKKPELGSNREVNLKIVKMIYQAEGSEKEISAELMIDNTSFSSDDYSVAYPTITTDGSYMIFSSDMPGGYGGLDLYAAQNIGGMWSNPVNLGDKINTSGNDAFPYIMPNGTLYFASNGHLGLGGLDIYESALSSDGTFGTPQNLKAPINSSHDDFGFYYDENVSGGYFTSRRPSMYGDDDIYSFTKESFIFEAMVHDSESIDMRLDSSKVVLTNLDSGDEVILYTDELGMVTHDISPYTRYRLDVSKDEYLPEQAEFTTTEDDVYAEIPLVKDYGIILDVTVLDVDTKKEIPTSDVILIDLATAQEVAQVTNQYGKTQFVLEENKEYRLKASKDLANRDSLYFSVTEDFNTYNTRAPANLFTEIELKKVCAAEGCEIIIDNIYYDLDKYFIRPDAATELNKLVRTLKENPTIHIELSSHTDCRGSMKYNTWLSAKRAESAVNYLIEQGIDYSRLTAAGYGETRPVNTCTCENGQGPGRTDKVTCDDEAHQDNRRTVFSITKF